MSHPRLDVWPPLPPQAWLQRRSSSLPFPLGEPGCTLYARARHGLAAGLGAVGLSAGDAVLAPAYHHGSEIEALVRQGIEPCFYEATQTLEPDEAELESLLGPRVRALYLTHYLGLPQDAARWRAWCDERGLLLLEDAAQAWLSGAGRLGDLAVFCLYKTCGLPDGAALVVAGEPVLGPPSPSQLGAAGLARRHAAWALGRSGRLARLAPARAGGDYDPAADFDLGRAAPPSRASLALLPRVARMDAAARRRRHYARLLDLLGELAPAPFDRLPDDASPFAFPLSSDDKPRLLARLRAGGVVPLDFWSQPHPSLPVERFPGAAERRARTVALPVHQELRAEDVEQLARCVDAGGRGRMQLPKA